MDCNPREKQTGWVLPRPSWVPEVGLVATAACSSRGGNAGLLATTKACVSARGGGQDPAVILTSKFATTKKLWVGTDHCPHLLESLCILSPWRDPLHGANSPGGAHDLIQTVASSSRLQLQQTLPHTPIGSAMPLPLPSPTEQVSPIKLLLSPAFVWSRNRTRGHPISRGGVKTKVKDQGQCDQIRGNECAPLGTMDQIPTISFRVWIPRATLDFGS